MRLESLIMAIDMFWSRFLSSCRPSPTVCCDVKDDVNVPLNVIINCKDSLLTFSSPIISARFGKVGKIRENATDFLPFFGTDIGFCSLVKPQLSFDPHLAHLPFSKKLFGPKGDNNSYSRRIKPGAKAGYFL